MSLFRIVSDFYGDVRGFGRSKIRAAVSRCERLSVEQLDALSRQHVQRRILFSLWRFPAYAAKVGMRRCVDGVKVRVEDLPIWTRQDQRDLFAALHEPPVAGAFVHSTGGSAGVPTRFYVSRESYEWRNGVSDRGYSWAGAEEGRKSYYVWGAPIKPLSRLNKLKVGLHHVIQRREYFNSFVFNDDRKMVCCHEINRFYPPVLVGYAGNLVDLALFVRSHSGALTWKARSLVIGAEGLQPGQRELLQETLADEVFMSYGSREFMLIGMECSQHRGYHISSDNLFVEVVDEQGQPVAPGETGRILVTDLHNDANPFIRYEIGDLGAWATEPCSCGLPFPLLERVEGRIQEFLVTADGGRLTALFIPHLMKEFGWIQGYQLEQSRPGVVRVNVLSDQDPAEAEVAPLVVGLKEKLGVGSSVDVVRVTSLKKSASGKVPVVVRSK